MGSSPVGAAEEEEVGAEAGITAVNVTELTEVTGDAVAATEAEEVAAIVTVMTGPMETGATTTETETAARMVVGVAVIGETGEGAVTAGKGSVAEEEAVAMEVTGSPTRVAGASNRTDSIKARSTRGRNNAVAPPNGASEK